MLVANRTLLDCAITVPEPSVWPRWQALATRSLEASGHNRPELIEAAFGHWSHARLALAEDGEALRLALPLAGRRFPVAVHENWSSPVNFFAQPHVDRDCAGPALAALLRRLETPLMLRAMPIEGPLWESLTGSATRLEILNRRHRPILRPTGSYAQWFETNFDRRRRSTLRRLRSRLAGQGRLEAVSFAHGDRADHWACAFMALESAGWKGRRRTAMQCDGTTARAFPVACAGLAAAGALRFWKLQLDGRPIAMLFGYADGRRVWLGKIAHDEAYGRFSPGVLLILHATEQLFAARVEQADSCVDAAHPMMDSLWRDRLPVADVLAAGPQVSGSRFRAAVLAESVRLRARRAARALRDRILR